MVSSPGKDMLITAAHCIHGGKGSGYRSDIVFIPGYRDGQEPFGVWTPAKLLVAPQWADSSDPDFDVGFVVLQPDDGRNIEQVLGANRLMTDTGYRYLVHVTGYPDSADSPVYLRELDVPAERDATAVPVRRIHRGDQRKPVGDPVQRPVADRRDRGCDRRVPAGR